MPILTIIVGLATGLTGAFLMQKKNASDVEERIQRLEKSKLRTEEEAKKLIDDARTQADNLREQSKKEEESLSERIDALKSKVDIKEELIKRKNTRNTETIEHLRAIEKSIEDIKEGFKSSNHRMIESLCKNLEEKSENIVEIIKSDLKNSFASLTPMNLEKITDDFAENGYKEAKNILTFILQRYSAGSSVDKKDMSIKVNHDRMKGMLIGKEGKNIEYFEKKLDVDVLFNHHGEDAITVSSHDLLKKTLAKETLELLMKEKSIDFELIDKCFDKASQKIDKIMHERGKNAVSALGLKDVPDKIANLFGRFEYRTSYGQNIWMHAMEVCFFSAMLAEEIGADYEVARLAGYVHDLGKAVDLQIVTEEGYHKDIAIELLDQNIADQLKGTEGHDDISKIIIDTWEWPEDPILRDRANYAAYCHHEKVPYRDPEDYLVKAADAISASRPGARAENVEWYLERIKQLEDLGRSVGHAKKAYSVSAGRELRIIIDEKAVNDIELDEIASKAANEIQETLSYPGKIKVNVIRITEFKEKVGK